jgi:hypothetical protein
MLDAMRMRTACFARTPQRCTSRLSKHFLLTFQAVTPLSKTRNQLRGPKPKENLIDLFQAAAERLGLKKLGERQVRIEVLAPECQR